MKQIILIFLIVLMGNSSAQFSNPGIEAACNNQFQNKIKSLLADYPERGVIEQILTHHANLSYHRLSHAFLQLKAEAPSATASFEQLTTTLGGDDRALEIISSLDTFNNYIYSQQDVSNKTEIQDQFENIFEGLMKTSQEKYGSDPSSAHLALRPGDRNILLNMMATRGGNPDQLFNHLSQEMNVVLSQRLNSVDSDIRIQAAFINRVQADLSAIDKEKMNDFIKYMKDQLLAFTNGPGISPTCQLYLRGKLNATDDRVECLDCEEFRNILSPQNEGILDDIFQVLNREFPIHEPANLRVQGPLVHDGCKIEDRNGQKFLILLNVTDIPIDRGDDTRAGSMFWLDTCQAGSFSQDATDPTCQSYQDGGVIKVRNEDMILRNPEGKTSRDQLEFPLPDTTNSTLYFRNDWTSGFERPIDISNCEESIPTPPVMGCEGIDHLFKQLNPSYEDTVMNFEQMLSVGEVTSEVCKSQLDELTTKFTELVKSDLHSGEINSIPFDEANSAQLLTSCGLTCDNYLQGGYSCASIPEIAQFLTDFSAGSLNLFVCLEKVEEIKTKDFSQYSGTTLGGQSLIGSPDEIQEMIFGQCGVNCEGLDDPCEPLKEIKTDVAGAQVALSEQGQDAIKTHLTSIWDAASYADFTGVDDIMVRCFPAPDVVEEDPVDSCETLQEILDGYYDNLSASDKDKCKTKKEALEEENPACDLKCKETSCEDFEKLFKEKYIDLGNDETLEGSACTAAIEEFKEEFEDVPEAKDCSYSCDGDDEDEDKDKTEYKHENLPEALIYRDGGTQSSKQYRMRGSGR